MTAVEQDRSLRRIGTALLDAAPQDWIKLRLVYAGLVDCERRGTWVYYWPIRERMEWISGLLATTPR
jgi:DNA-binding transcriptional ArsR family regulator